MSSWDPVNLEIASSRKFKWLRERVGGSSQHTMLLNQIKNFILTDEVDIKLLNSILKRQVSTGHCVPVIWYDLYTCVRV